MDHLFYSLLTAFVVGVNGSIHVRLIPNSRLSRKVAKNPFIERVNSFLELARAQFAKYSQMFPKEDGSN